MKAVATQKIIKELLGAPVHYGRPHTPDDEAWIEPLIRSLKHHRETPQNFSQGDLPRYFGIFVQANPKSLYFLVLFSRSLAHMYKTNLQCTAKWYGPFYSVIMGVLKASDAR